MAGAVARGDREHSQRANGTLQHFSMHDDGGMVGSPCGELYIPGGKKAHSCTLLFSGRPG